MALSPADVGQRIVVRRKLGVENGRQQYGDVLGVLSSYTDGVLVIHRRDGSDVAVPEAEVVAGKRVPPPPAPRPPDSGEGLALVSAAGWPAVETQTLGDWLLQAANGFTGRANSVVPAGEPGVPLASALTTVRAFYAERGLPPLIQTVVGTSLEDALEAAGWVVRPSGKTPYSLVDVRVARLADVDLEQTANVDVDSPLDDDWLELYGRSSSPEARHVLTGGGQAPVALARLGKPLQAIGRGVVTGPWLGIGAVEVAQDARRRGHGLAIMAALIAWGSHQGARWSYLQVGTDNEPAQALYERLGYRTDHQYRYYTPG
ncbi:GNAT family N-acetyltransferase [Tenggerimyces flavus]|uniref:GNAT family N-acetyltransferase n=1 Tax=Tenggerimyces flavus TaxID=1708749 RepID=A0ABV7YJE8_9ACTN|nr:GNAT family N-acetyltransferase [Tenggerimyces flavus]MBM7790946.1 GNAT superfamily N-acetyltransferase [Tenggerimyces flavus]